MVNMAIAALGLVLIALALQALGHSGTCTQGNDGPFITGAIFSFPLLVGVAACLLRVLRCASPNPAHPIIQAVSLLATAGVLGLMLYVNQDVIAYTLFDGITPCGPDQVSPDIARRPDRVPLLVAAVYGVFPALAWVMATFAAVRLLVQRALIR